MLRPALAVLSAVALAACLSSDALVPTAAERARAQQLIDQAALHAVPVAGCVSAFASGQRVAAGGVPSDVRARFAFLRRRQRADERRLVEAKVRDVFVRKRTLPSGLFLPITSIHLIDDARILRAPDGSRALVTFGRSPRVPAPSASCARRARRPLQRLLEGEPAGVRAAADAIERRDERSAALIRRPITAAATVHDLADSAFGTSGTLDTTEPVVAAIPSDEKPVRRVFALATDEVTSVRILLRGTQGSAAATVSGRVADNLMVAPVPARLIRDLHAARVSWTTSDGRSHSTELPEALSSDFVRR